MYVWQVSQLSAYSQWNRQWQSKFLPTAQFHELGDTVERLFAETEQTLPLPGKRHYEGLRVHSHQPLLIQRLYCRAITRVCAEFRIQQLPVP